MPNNWSEVGNLATVVAAVLTALGILFAFGELKRNTRLHRAEFLLQTVAQYFGDVEVRRLF